MLHTSPENNLILVVDDTLTNLEIISVALIDSGFTVITAINGEQAIQQIESRLPDLILLDVMMPRMDGFETCQKIKANPLTQDIPVIFMTGITDTDSKVKALNLGAIDYITKPFQKEEVLARIQTHLQLRNLNKNLEKIVAERTAKLDRTLRELQEFQVQLVKQEKMSVLGQLVTGIAHEINNPVSCIYGNLGHALTYFQNLINLIELYQKNYPEPVEPIQDAITAMDLDYVCDDLPNLIFAMKEGIQRIRDISNGLRIFSRADTENKVECNIHEGIDSTLLILKHRLKGSEISLPIEVIKDYGDLPLIECFPGQLNQAFMNILANAVDALEESNDKYSLEQPKQISICTMLSEDENHVLIKIRDNGTGMSSEIQQRIFEYLFTTKPVGKGTGLGLAIAHQIIVQKHQGNLEVNSQIGMGSEFIITIPNS
ncbi:sensor histidine kinase [Nostoc sp. CMAA1605]|uniref:sensor histidine kinase n=1 Tax=Nostoc sp. CMAA1605 TaxID=2055159 RepID=UPI001F26D6B7|nr:response regulator [Nostoc sp. CMAA1605]MCF4969268.1 hybrid sensor histidine kinase/response regulator [Nostoc sp. CMAA1605]